MTARPAPLDTRHKALDINLDPSRYGTFAEIGAGQEVVRWFFTVGAAAGTIAKSISAYDMRVSDTIYGPSERYVSRARLETMLDHEQQLNRERLDQLRGDTTAFFAFADTVTTRSHQGNNECHAWMGIRFQAHPRDAENQIVIHVRMLDSEAVQQQEALGIVGVNLVYGACRLSSDPDALVSSLLDGLSPQRVEIDMIDFSGVEFQQIDNRVLALKLVQLGFTQAAMFSADGRSVQPAEALYKKAVLIQRGTFRPPTLVHVDMQRCGLEAFSRDAGVGEDQIVSLLEITMHNLRAEGEFDLRDFLSRAEVLAAAGLIVLISDYAEYHRLTTYLARLMPGKIGLILGAAGLRDIFDETYYTDLEGGILEALGRLFKTQVKLYVYPYRDPETATLLTAETLQLGPPLQRLYDFLRERGGIEDLKGFDQSCLHILSRDVLQRIHSGDSSWEEMVPPRAVEIIKSNALFGHR